MTEEPAIVTRNLRKTYGATRAVDGLDLDVPAGSICGLLGRNGAGKTTTLKMLMGITRPDAGEGHVFGLRIGEPRESLAIRARTGFVPEDKPAPDAMTVGEMIRFTRAFYPQWRADLEERFLRIFQLPARATAAALSKGARCQLALLLALSRGADLLILDEPTGGLDPAMSEEVLQALVTLAGEGRVTILFSSHQVGEVEQIADRVCIMDRGRAVLNDSIDELKTAYRSVRLVFDGKPPSGAFEGAREEGRTLSLLLHGDVEEVVARGRAMRALSVDVAPVTLKDIFIAETKGAGQ
jgi:ABC-2 type transport system ATP-binding protein